MVVTVYRKAPWWIHDPENRPTKEGFEGWLATGAQSFPINKAHIVKGVRSLTINLYLNTGKYFKVTYSDFTYYYYVKDLTLIANGLYQYQIELDLWTTFCIPYLEKLREKNAQVYFKRATFVPHIFDIATQSQYVDPLLEEIQPQYAGLKYLLQKNTSEKETLGPDKQRFYSSDGWTKNDATASKRFITNATTSIYTCEYYVFSTVDGKFIDCYPVINNNKHSFKIGWIQNGNLVNYKVYNNHTSALNQLKIDNEVRFKGIFILPSIMHWDMETNGEPFVGGGLSDLFGIRINPQLPIVNWIRFDLNHDIELINRENNKLNVKNKLLSPAILKYFNFKLYNAELFPTDFMNNEDGIFGFGSKFGVNWKFTNRGIVYYGSKYSKIESIPKELTGQLPSISSSYDKFIAANEASINAGIGLSFVPAIGSLIALLITGATGGLGAGIGAGIAAASIAGGVGASISQAKTNISRVVDAKNANQTTNSNTMSRDAFWSQGVVPDDDIGYVKNAGMIINYTDISNIEEYNNVVVKYGYIFNKRYNIDQIWKSLTDDKSDYCYVNFDVDQVYQENKELNDIAPTYFINDILNEFKNGVRLWKVYHMVWKYEN